MTCLYGYAVYVTLKMYAWEITPTAATSAPEPWRLSQESSAKTAPTARLPSCAARGHGTSHRLDPQTAIWPQHENQAAILQFIFISILSCVGQRNRFYIHYIIQLCTLSEQTCAFITSASSSKTHCRLCNYVIILNIIITASSSSCSVLCKDTGITGSTQRFRNTGLPCVIVSGDQPCVIVSGDQPCVIVSGDQPCVIVSGDQPCVIVSGDQPCVIVSGDQPCVIISPA